MHQNVMKVNFDEKTVSLNATKESSLTKESSCANHIINNSFVQNVKCIFNEMVDEYDKLDLWYSHTFGYIDFILRKKFFLPTTVTKKPIALDIGCGTGIQSLRLASLGYKVIGIDIADKLLNKAREKLFARGYKDSIFLVADAQILPLDSEIADFVNCCGPTLSFIPDYKKALSEISRCLKPGGRLLLEVEGKWNFDIFWEIINALFFNALSYDETIYETLRHVMPPWNIGHKIDYTFKPKSKEEVKMFLKLFTPLELARELDSVSLKITDRFGLHSITNIIPSTILHNSSPKKPIKNIFNILQQVENICCNKWPFNAFACSLLIIAQKYNKTEGD